MGYWPTPEMKSRDVFKQMTRRKYDFFSFGVKAKAKKAYGLQTIKYD